MKRIKILGKTMLGVLIFLIIMSGSWTMVFGQEKVTITMWAFPIAGEAEDMKYYKPLVDKFEQQNPGIQVEIEIFPWENRAERFTLAIMGNRAPDIGYLNADNFAQFADLEALVPLRQYIPDEMWNDLKPSCKELVTWKDKFYVMPILATASPPWYNMDLLNEAGITDLPTNWEEYEDLCKKTTKDLDGDGKIDQWGTTHGLLPFGPWFLWLSWFYQAGGQWLNGEMTQATFNDENGVEALEFIVKLYDNYMNPMDKSKGQHYNELFLTGKAASIWAEEQGFIKIVSKEYPNLNFKLGPILKHKDQVTMGTVGGYGIFKQSKHPDAAAKWILFFTNKENLLDFLESYYFLSPRISIDPALKERIKDPNFHVAVDASSYARDMVNHPASAQFMKEILIAIQEAVLHEKSPQSALDDAVEKMNVILKTDK